MQLSCQSTKKRVQDLTGQLSGTRSRYASLMHVLRFVWFSILLAASEVLSHEREYVDSKGSSVLVPVSLNTGPSHHRLLMQPVRINFAQEAAKCKFVEYWCSPLC